MPVRLGDPTSHGCAVTSASDQANIFGKPLARPFPGHGDCVLVEGAPN